MGGRCNGCSLKKLKYELGDKFLLLPTGVYELDREPVDGQDDPQEWEGRHIRFHWWGMDYGHSDECYNWKPPKKDKKKMESERVAPTTGAPIDYKVTHSFFIAGVQHHQMKTILNDMEVGNNLLISPEPTNNFDPNAIRLEWATFEKQIMCGYVPRKFSSEVAAMLEVGKDLECVIVELNKTAKPWEQCRVEIREVVE